MHRFRTENDAGKQITKGEGVSRNRSQRRLRLTMARILHRGFHFVKHNLHNFFRFLVHYFFIGLEFSGT